MYVNVCIPHYNSSFTYTQWLEEEFMGYLQDWEKSVRGRRECTKSEQLMMLLSAETRLGIEITGMQHSTIYILQYACFLVYNHYTREQSCINYMFACLQFVHLWNWSDMCLLFLV